MGNWDSLVEMEECLTLQELNILVEGAREKEERQQKFLAAIQGIDLDEGDETLPSFEDVKRKAAAIAAGQNEDVVEFNEFGIDFES